MKRFLQLILRFFSRAIVRRYRPMIIGVTGSVGKTSAKQAIFAVVSARYRSRATSKNYNDEIGVPLTIIGVDSPGHSFVGWLYVFYRALRLMLLRDRQYPHVLVLEMGADRKGDISYLTSFAPPHIGVVTAVGEAHFEFFGDAQSIFLEKSTLVSGLKSEHFAILNADDEAVGRMASLTQARVIMYGQSESAHVRAVDIGISYLHDDGFIRPSGIRCKIQYEGSTVPIFLDGVLGMGHVSAALAAASVGVSLGMNMVEVAQSLSRVEFPSGRMRILDGIKRSVIIDDTYNASPLAMIFALDALRDVDVLHGRRIAVMGDMLELGSISVESHRDLGVRLQAFNVNKLVVVGAYAQLIADAAIAAGFDEHCVARFQRSEDAGLYVQEMLMPGDIVLVKGSQGVRLEKIVLEIMATPENAERLLCRQGSTWL